MTLDRYDKWLMAPYEEEAHTEPRYEQYGNQIASYIHDYTERHEELPDAELVADIFDIQSQSDIDEIEKYIEEEREIVYE